MNLSVADFSLNNFFGADFLIANAWAADPAPANAAGGLLGFLPLIILFAIFYFLLIRPQAKRAKEHKAMIEALVKGDEVIVGGGIAGKIAELGDSFIAVEVANGVVLKVQRHSVQAVLPKGTLK